MRTKGMGGFTVIEVTIFLAITGMMILIAIAGVGSRISQTRFTDSVRSYESYMQGQFDEVLSGVNTRTASIACSGDGSVATEPGQSTNCLLLGRYISFTNGSSTMQSRPIIGTDANAISSDDSDLTALTKVAPTLATVDAQNYDIPWQASIYNSKDAAGKQVNAVAIVRSPVSASTFIFAFRNTNPSNPVLTPYLVAANQGRSVTICVQSADRLTTYGALTLSPGGRGQDAISTRADITSDTLVATCEGTL